MFYGSVGVQPHLRCWENTRKGFKSRYKLQVTSYKFLTVETLFGLLLLWNTLLKMLITKSEINCNFKHILITVIRKSGVGFPAFSDDHSAGKGEWIQLAAKRLLTQAYTAKWEKSLAIESQKKDKEKKQRLSIASRKHIQWLNGIWTEKFRVLMWPEFSDREGECGRVCKAHKLTFIVK